MNFASCSSWSDGGVAPARSTEWVPAAILPGGAALDGWPWQLPCHPDDPSRLRSIDMTWETPAAFDMRFGFEITMYISTR
jgi:coenzyme PQQ precursor peptide PqqA